MTFTHLDIRMTRVIADQIADLLNTQNHLDQNVSGDFVLESAQDFLFECDGDGVLMGVIAIRHIQWYQAELFFGSTNPKKQTFGYSFRVFKRALEMIKIRGIPIIQATTRTDNLVAQKFLSKVGFNKTQSFYNLKTGSNVLVYQLCMVPSLEEL